MKKDEKKRTEMRLIISNGKFSGEVDFIVPAVAIDDGDATVGFGDEQHVDFTPARHAIVKRFARQYQDVTSIIELIEATTQALLMGHEQVAVQRHHAQAQVSATGDNEFGMKHRSDDNE